MNKIVPEKLVNSRLPEVILVTLVTIVLMSLANYTLPVSSSHLVLPCILIAAATIPSLIRNEKLSELGLTLTNITLSLKLVVVACLVSGPIIYIFVLILASQKINIPVASKVSYGNWLAWITYQVMYIGVAEELFFRGYVIRNLGHPSNSRSSSHTDTYQVGTIIISAILFAMAHMIILQNFLSALTFFPGLLFGWLFIRTRSLVAPILFHAIANIAYALIISQLA